MEASLKINQMPKTLQKIIAKAPLAWGLIALYDYRSKRKTVKEIQQEWDVWERQNKINNAT